MSDTREDILVRLQAILATVPGVVSSWRNRGELQRGDLPAAILLDGREELLDRNALITLKSRQMPPALMVLQPQIFVVLAPRDTVENLVLDNVSAPIGPEISAFRAQVIDRVTNDPTLMTILGPVSQIVYLGCETDMQTGSAIAGEIQFRFEFIYVFTPPSI